MAEGEGSDDDSIIIINFLSVCRRIPKKQLVFNILSLCRMSIYLFIVVQEQAAEIALLKSEIKNAEEKFVKADKSGK